MEEKHYQNRDKEKERVGPTYEDVLRYSLTPRSAIDLSKMLELEGRFGGRCDVLSGYCACGAWH